jgi:hypothetical protein
MMSDQLVIAGCNFGAGPAGFLLPSTWLSWTNDSSGCIYTIPTIFLTSCMFWLTMLTVAVLVINNCTLGKQRAKDSPQRHRGMSIQETIERLREYGITRSFYNQDRQAMTKFLQEATREQLIAIMGFTNGIYQDDNPIWKWLRPLLCEHYTETKIKVNAWTMVASD